MPPTDLRKRVSLFQHFLLWLINLIVIPLLKTNFYVTESSPFKNRTFYFRHETWIRLTSPLYLGLKNNMLQVVDGNVITKDTSLWKKNVLGYSHIRFLPKDLGARPIMNLKRKISKHAS